jgi:hypothetical protein
MANDYINSRQFKEYENSILESLGFPIKHHLVPLTELDFEGFTYEEVLEALQYLKLQRKYNEE